MSKKWLISVMATAMVFTLGLGAGCFGTGNNSSEPINSSSKADATLSLDKTTATISEYETLQLNATAENGEGDVEWSTSSAAVATVDANGVVTGVSEGTATITATYAGLQATCEVTVVKAESPVMTVSASNIAMNKKESQSVTVSTTWKGQEVEDVEYNWYLEDETLDWSTVASIEVSEDGKTATFTGIGQGTEKYQVYAHVNGEDLIQTITIKVVDNSITFSVANLDKGAEAYVADLSLAEGEGLVQSVKPEVSVYYEGALQEGVVLNYVNSDPTVAEMQADGTIVVLKEGVATFSADVQIQDSTATLNIRVNAYRPEFNIGNVVIETGRESKALNLGELNVQGTVNSVKVAGGEMFASHAEGVVTLDAEKMPQYTEDLGEGKTFVMETEKAIYVATADVYTLVVRTRDDFALIGKAAYAADVGALKWGGYFVLGNDIDMEGKGYGAIFSYVELDGYAAENNIQFGVGTAYGDNASDGRYNGFHGIFDGKGYAIKNIVTNYWGGGLFPVFGGTFKNVAFTNAHLSGKTSLIGDHISGTIENVYVQVASADAEASVFNYATGNGNAHATTRINNCFVDFPATGAEHVSLARLHDGYGCVNGLYTVGAHAGFNTISVGGGQKHVWGAYNSYADLVAAYDFTTWEGDFWTTVNGAPVPKGVELGDIGNSDYTVDTTFVSIGSELKVSGKYATVSLTPSAMRLGITNEGNKIIIPNDQLAIGGQAMVIVSNFFNPDDYKELILTVVGTEQFQVGDVENPQGVDLNATDVAIDLTSIKDNIVGTIAGVKAGNVRGNATYEDGIVKVDLSSMGNLYGAGTLVIEFNVYDDNENLIKVQQVSVPVKGYRVLTTAEHIANLSSYLAMDGNNAYADLRLGADIDVKGAVVGVGTWSNGWTHNFTGTFDGQGYTISNAKSNGGNGGLFCCIDAKGVVKNVNFYNAQVMGDTGFIVTENNGTVENVFVHGSIFGGGAFYAPPSLIAAKNQGMINNCIVVLDSMTIDPALSHGGMLAGWSHNANRPGTVQNSVAINLSGNTIYGVGTQGYDKNEAYIANSTEKASDANTIANGWAEYFAVADSIEYDDWAATALNALFNSVKGATVGKTEISLGDTVQINANLAAVKSFALKEEVAGVSVDAKGLITVSEAAAAKTAFTVVVTFADDTTVELAMTTGMKAC